MPRTIFFILIVSERGEAQQSGQESGPLKDLNQVAIVIQNLNSGEKSLGISERQLESQVLVGLKRDIPRLVITENASSIISVNVTALRNTTTGGREIGYAFFLRLELVRPAIILSDDYQTRIKFADAPVWNRGYLQVGSPVQRITGDIRERIDRFLTDFAADYYRQNP